MREAAAKRMTSGRTKTRGTTRTLAKTHRALLQVPQYPRLSAVDAVDTEPVRFASFPDSTTALLSLRALADARDVVERREDGNTWAVNPYLSVDRTTEARVDRLRERLLLSHIDVQRPGCCGAGHGSLTVAVFDTAQDGGTWTQRTRRAFVDDRVRVSALAVDAGGGPHLAYVRNQADHTSTKGLIYAACETGTSCAYEDVGTIPEDGYGIGLVLDADGRHRIVTDVGQELHVFARSEDGAWSDEQQLDVGFWVRNVIVEQGFGRDVVIASGSAVGGGTHVATYERLGDSWDEIAYLEYPWVLNSDPGNRNVEARLTEQGLVIGSGACLEHEERDGLVECVRGGWRVFREAEDFAMEEIFVDGTRHATAPILGADGSAFSVGATDEQLGLQPVSGERRAPAYTYPGIDDGTLDFRGSETANLEVYFPAQWSGEWTEDPVEAPAQLHCILGGRNPGFATLQCEITITHPGGAGQASRTFTAELDETMRLSQATDGGHIEARLVPGDDGLEVTVDDVQVVEFERSLIHAFEPMVLPLRP